MSSKQAPKRRLEASGQALKTIAHRCGFGGPARMRAAFVKHLGVTAQQYRLNFGFAGIRPAPRRRGA